MVFPSNQRVYSSTAGTDSIPEFVFSPVDPGENTTNYPIYQGWVNTTTKALWYLEALVPFNGTLMAQWRAVGPIVLMDRTPSSGDYQYPLGQTWVDTAANSYWALVNVTGTVATWTNCTGGGGGSGIQTLTGNSGGAVGADGSSNVNIVGSGSVTVTGNPGSHTLTIAVSGSTGNVQEIGVDAFTGPGTNPVLPTAMDGLITVTGSQVAAGTTTNVIRTDSLAANTYTIEIQRSQAVASSTIGDNGVCHFNSADFTVDANGFVSSVTSQIARKIEVDTFTNPGTNPVEPTSDGVITVTGGQVPAHTTANAIQTDSLAANTYTIQIQRSAADAVATVGDNGICHFNSADFTVDSNGFVSAISSTFTRLVEVDTFTNPGTNPVEPTDLGVINVTGAQVAAGTTPNVIRTDSLAVNTYTIEIQRSQAVATSTLADNGVSHFNSADFTVDSSGFVSAKSSTFTREVGVDTSSGSGTNPVVPTSAGLITVTGAIANAGTTPVQTNSNLANTYEIQIQKSQAIASANAANIGLSAFNSADFTVDSTGFVSLVGSGSGIQTIDGNSGSVTGTTVTLTTGASNIQGTSKFTGSGTTMTQTFTDADGNTGLGQGSLSGLSGGTDNSCYGQGAGSAITSGERNTCVGFQAGLNVSSGTDLTAIGYGALSGATGASNGNVAVGSRSQFANASGLRNVSMGTAALSHVVSGNDCTAVGDACLNDTTGSGNTGLGSSSLAQVVGGAQNTAVGYQAGYNYVGSESNNVLIGYGVTGTAAESNVIRIGNNSNASCYITGIDGVNVGSVAKVVTEASNQLGTATLTAGSGITITPTANTITIASSGGSGIMTIDGDLGSITGATVSIGGGATGLSTNGAGTAMTLGGDLVVAHGGTGNTTFTAYAPVCAGTTATGAFQSADSGISNSGYVLTSTGSSSLPTWQAAGGFSSINIQTITSTGTYTPTANMVYCIAEIVGGGGGGANTTSGQCASGGGGGGYARGAFSAATIGVSQSVTIGAGGGAGAPGSSTTFGSLLTATGGAAGIVNSSGGAGGVGTVGTVLSAGGAGSPGTIGAGFFTGGSGGNSFFGGGAPGTGVSIGSVNGNSGTAYGGGGSSGTANSGSSSAGSGSAGVCIVTEYIK